jgi:2-polyprenyl-6-hydroxyphenyl methylase/3-demethylubiquinone-9 3-methyltransferase
MSAIVDNGIYDRVAGTWWDEDGFMALLRTSVNPPRAAWFRDVLHERGGAPLAGLRLLDVGCGGGLLAEEFATLGLSVTGIDPSLPTLAAARAHAERGGLAIDYRAGRAEALPFADGEFDVVSCCDVLEHVDDPDAVIAQIARVLRPGGLFLFDTINRTLRSKLVAIKLMQDWAPTRLMPRDVHVWEKFIRPAELATMLRRHGLGEHALAGLAPPRDPRLAARALAAWARTKYGAMSFAELGSRLPLRVGDDLSISYLGWARRD